MCELTILLNITELFMCELTNQLGIAKLFMCELIDQLDITEFHRRINKPVKTLPNFNGELTNLLRHYGISPEN